MDIHKHNIKGNDSVGAFASLTDTLLFLSPTMNSEAGKRLSEELAVKAVPISICESDLLGIWCRANSKGMLIPDMVSDEEKALISSIGVDLRVEVLQSRLNAVGNNVLANDRIAIINPNYSTEEAKVISDVLGVETVKMAIGGFKTVGANNILTNKGAVLNNRCTDDEMERVKELTGFQPVRSTASTEALSVGLSVLANSRAALFGELTTGYEMARIIDSLEGE
jgi:translation initiation factor 6